MTTPTPADCWQSLPRARANSRARASVNVPRVRASLASRRRRQFGRRLRFARRPVGHLQEVVEFVRLVLAQSLIQRLGEEAAGVRQPLRDLPVGDEGIRGVP